MTDLWIKDIPEDLAAALQQQAARNGRSLAGELIAILQQGVGSGAVVSDRGISAFFVTRRGTRTVEDFVAESRIRYPEPVRDQPLGVDIIRADRDSR